MDAYTINLKKRLARLWLSVAKKSACCPGSFKQYEAYGEKYGGHNAFARWGCLDCKALFPELNGSPSINASGRCPCLMLGVRTAVVRAELFVEGEINPYE